MWGKWENQIEGSMDNSSEKKASQIVRISSLDLQALHCGVWQWDLFTQTQPMGNVHGLSTDHFNTGASTQGVL